MEVGDYVRTLNGKIWIIKSQKAISGHKKDIIKSSPNIIDLIEVGDYVNGERVINIIKKHKYLEVSDEEIIIDEKDIKSIVTKEQFSCMEYEVK